MRGEERRGGGGFPGYPVKQDEEVEVEEEEEPQLPGKDDATCKRKEKTGQ